MTKEDILRELNGDLAYEFAAAIQYIQHAATITGGEFQSIDKELLVHVNEEISHANILAEQIDYLGGIPTMDVAERYTDRDPRRMLEQDLEGERIAIKRYKDRIMQAQELRFWGLETALKQILADEEEHERDIMEALGM